MPHKDKNKARDYFRRHYAKNKATIAAKREKKYLENPELRPLESKKQRNKPGYRARQAAYSKEYRARKREYLQAQKKEYYDKNKERILAEQREARMQNKGGILEREAKRRQTEAYKKRKARHDKEYAKKNRERLLAYKKEYYLTHKERLSTLSRTRYLKIRNTPEFRAKTLARYLASVQREERKKTRSPESYEDHRKYTRAYVAKRKKEHDLLLMAEAMQKLTQIQGTQDDQNTHGT